jgi:phytoene synthase
MYAIYAWMREADDLADDLAGASEEARLRGRERVATFRAWTDRALAGELVDQAPTWRALAHVAPRYRLVAKEFHDMLDGQLADLDGAVRCERWEDLRLVCYRVASTVGLVCIRIWGFHDPRAIECAIDRGIAFQLTNILRDVREDLAVGRSYLPMSEYAAHGLSPEELLCWSKPESCERFLRFQMERAEEHYRRSAPLDAMISPECVPTLWAMTEIYHRLLRKIARRPRAVVGGGRVRLSALEKFWIAFQARRLPKAQKSVVAPAGAAAP